MRAVSPSADKATLAPNAPAPFSPPPVSFVPSETNKSLGSG